MTLDIANRSSFRRARGIEIEIHAGGLKLEGRARAGYEENTSGSGYNMYVKIFLLFAICV